MPASGLAKKLIGRVLLIVIFIGATTARFRLDARTHKTITGRRVKQDRGMLNERARIDEPGLDPKWRESLCHTRFWDRTLVVAARYEEDVSWMAAELTAWQPYLVYSIMGREANATHKTKSNTGRESQAYLQFIVDYYDCLPQTTAFIHAHQFSPHSPDVLSDLKRLQWQSIPGFLSMSRPQRINTFYFFDSEKHKPSPEDMSETAKWSQFAYEQNLLIKEVWAELFARTLGELPEQLTTPGCGQFAVTQNRIRRHPRQFYQEALKWLQTTTTDGFWAGLIFEHMWSYIFGAGTEYLHPEECSMFACDTEGNPFVPHWESLASWNALPRSRALQRGQL